MLLKIIDKNSTTIKYLLGMIIVLGLALRIWGINYDLPYIYHPDEPVYVNISQAIFKTGDLNPHFFNYPSLFFYLNALAYIPYYLVGKVLGVFSMRLDILGPSSLVMGVTLAPFPTSIVLGRLVTILFGTLTVLTTYLTSKILSGSAWIGLLSALAVATSPINVLLSRYITPDSFVSFFISLSVFLSLLIYKEGKLRYYILTGVSIGLAISSKYNGAIFGVVLVLAHFFRYGMKGIKIKRFYLALLCIFVSFIVTTPYAVIDFQKFWNDFRFESQHYSTGHAGMEGNSLFWYLSFLWKTESIMFLVSVVAIIYSFLSRKKEHLLISITSLIYFFFIASFVVRNDRTVLPIISLLLVSALSFIGILYSKIKLITSVLPRRFASLLTILIIIVGMSLPLNQTISDGLSLTKLKSRETSRIWIVNNLPKGSKIGIESYSPYIDPTQFSIQGFGRIIDKSPDWYIENNYDYLIFSQGMYGRFFREPERYSIEVEKYKIFFDKYTLIRKFDDQSNEILIYHLE